MGRSTGRHPARVRRPPAVPTQPAAYAARPPAVPTQPHAPMATRRETRPERLGDFTATPRVTALSLIAAWLGIVGAFIALALLRTVVHRMADTGLTRFPVIERGEARRLVGMVSLRDLLKARALDLDAERRRERVLPLRLAFPRRVPARKV